MTHVEEQKIERGKRRGFERAIFVPKRSILDVPFASVPSRFFPIFCSFFPHLPFSFATIAKRERMEVVRHSTSKFTGERSRIRGGKKKSDDFRTWLSCANVFANEVSEGTFANSRIPGNVLRNC